MTVRAEKAQIFFSIVQPVATDVIDMKGQWLTPPYGPDLTSRTAMWHPDGDQAPPELPGVRSRASFGQDDEDLLGVATPGRGLASAVGLAEEVGGVDPEVLQAAADVGMGAARPFHAQVAEDVGDADGAGRGLGQHFGGVLVIGGHAPSMGNAADNSWGMVKSH
jgi:hypothetical protein